MTKSTFIRILLFSGVCLFAGRALQHFFLDIPIREILWDQSLMENFIHRFLNLSWEQYVSDPVWDMRIQYIVRLMGLLYLSCFVVCVTLFFFLHKKGGALLIAGSFGLFLLAGLYFTEKFFRLGELMEYTLQWTTPLLIYFLIFKPLSGNAIIAIMKIATALTFAGHGLYAIGFYPIPGNFIDMVIMSLGTSEETAIVILKTAGWLDLLIALTIMVPGIESYAAFYASIWGLLTAIARVWANFNTDFIAESLYLWLPEVLFRLPHALIPFALYFALRQEHARKIFLPQRIVR